MGPASGKEKFLRDETKARELSKGSEEMEDENGFRFSGYSRTNRRYQELSPVFLLLMSTTQQETRS